MLVPLPRAASRRLMSFLTFHISIYDKIFQSEYGECDTPNKGV